MIAEFIYLIPECFLLFSALIMLFSNRKEALCFFSFSIAAYLVLEYGSYVDSTAFNNLLFFGSITQYTKTFVLVLSALVSLIFWVDKKYINSNGDKLLSNADHIPTMCIFSVIGMMLVISSNSLMALYIALELQSLPMYVMAASDRSSIKSSEAGIKYFVLGSLSSCIMLYGISLIYINSGELSFLMLDKVFIMNDNFAVFIGALFILVGLFFKLAIVPFHVWISDVYHGSPKRVVAFFATVPKISIVFLMCRIFDTSMIFDFTDNLPEVSLKNPGDILKKILIFFGVFSIFAGSLLAMAQNGIKRLLACSTVSHLGYILVAIAVSDYSYGLAFFLSPGFLYIAFYSILNLGIFSFVMMFKEDKISDFAGLGKKMTLVPLCFSLMLLSAAGLPPFVGFFVKFSVIMKVISSGFVFLSLMMLISSAFTLYYSLKILKTIYFDNFYSDLHVNKSNLLITFATIVAITNVVGGPILYFVLFMAFWV